MGIVLITATTKIIIKIHTAKKHEKTIQEKLEIFS